MAYSLGVRQIKKLKKLLKKNNFDHHYVRFEIPPDQRQMIMVKRLICREGRGWTYEDIYTIYPSSKRVVKASLELDEWMEKQRRETSLAQAMEVVVQAREWEELLEKRQSRPITEGLIRVPKSREWAIQQIENAVR